MHLSFSSHRHVLFLLIRLDVYAHDLFPFLFEQLISVTLQAQVGPALIKLISLSDAQALFLTQFFTLIRFVLIWLVFHFQGVNFQP